MFKRVGTKVCTLIFSQRIETDVSAKKPETVEEPSDVIELCHNHIRTAAHSAPPSPGEWCLHTTSLALLLLLLRITSAEALVI